MRMRAKITGCLVTLGGGLLAIFSLMAGVFYLLSSGDVAEVHQHPVAYAALEEYEHDKVPPFAQTIYRASYADWQVAEWIWRFDVPAESEAQLLAWAAQLPGWETKRAVGDVSHLKAPEWWKRSEDACILCRREEDFRYTVMWYSSTQKRCWLLYVKK